VSWRQSLDGSAGQLVLADVEGTVCGVEVTHGLGRAVVLAAALPSSPILFGRVLDRLGVRRGLELTASTPGVFATTTRDSAGNRLLHVINISGYRPDVSIRVVGVDRRLSLRPAPHTGYMLPLGVDLGHARLAWANAEVLAVSGGEVRFGPPAGEALEVEWDASRPNVPLMVEPLTVHTLR
jgi:beta-galactosidase